MKYASICDCWLIPIAGMYFIQMLEMIRWKIGGQSGTGHIYLNIHLTKGFLIEHIDRLAPLFSRTDSNEEDQVGVSHIYGNLDGE